MGKIDWYSDFVDLSYVPAKDDIKVLYYFEPAKGMSVKEVAGRIASESSAGTWTTLYKLPKRVAKIKARAYHLTKADTKNGIFARIAYPKDLWEKPGNAPQLLSGIAGNIFGMKALDNLRLVDASIPKSYLKGFRGPEYGIKGLRKLLKVKKRPITGAVPKPKIGFSAKEHAQIGYETWMGGFDLVKDDENLTSTSFNRFKDRINFMSKLRDKAEKETGERKSALINITADTKLMEKRAKMLHNLGWEYAMVDVVTTGTGAVQTIREVCHDYKLAIHAHRAMHASFDRNTRHGITMLFLAKLMRMIGVDQIHIGTTVGKLVGTRHDVMDIERVITSNALKVSKSKETKHMMSQDWAHIKPTLPVSSGGLHPGLIPDVIGALGTDIALLVSGGIHGHPKGTRAGAKAAMQAIEATMKKITLEDYAKNHIELAEALGKWGRYRPK